MAPKARGPVSSRGHKPPHLLQGPAYGKPNSSRSSGTQIPYNVGSSGSRTWTNRASEPAPLPSLEPLNAAQRSYLWSRGLRQATVARHKLAADGPAIVFPVFESGELINAVWHRPWYRVRYESVRGRDACLFPVPHPPSSSVLVAGMFDALVARQHGVPAITTTCGAVLPSNLAGRFAGKHVALLYDVGEEQQAAATLRTLKGVGADAWTVTLPLAAKSDVADWFGTHARTREELYELIRAARRAA